MVPSPLRQYLCVLRRLHSVEEVLRRLRVGVAVGLPERRQVPWSGLVVARAEKVHAQHLDSVVCAVLARATKEADEL